MENKNSLEGKNIIILGGAKNLGQLIAKDFANYKVKSIVIHYHSNESKKSAIETVNYLLDKGINSLSLQYDLREAKQVEDLFLEVVNRIGKLDIAINTVGKVLKKSILETSEEEFDDMISINSKSAFFFIKEAGKHINNNGKIINLVTSLLGAFTGFYSTYAGSKSAVEHFVRAASKEFGSRGISINAIGPGPMDTPFFYGQETQDAVLYHKTAAALSKFSPTGLTNIEDVVPLIRFLASEGWWITGQTILINGGYTTK